MIAIDANIAVKWYVPEDDSQRALILFNNPRPFVAPSLIRMEVCAAITRRVRRNELTAHEALDHCQDWFADLRDGEVRLVPDEELLHRAIELSLEIRHGLQDCLYLAVAQAHGIPLITADATFHERALPHYPNTHLLGRWQAN